MAIEADTGRTAVVFIHGLFSSPAIWVDLANALQSDSLLAERTTCHMFSYATWKRWPWIGRRVPDLDTIATGLETFIGEEIPPDDHLVLVSHSQGGLVVQNHLARMLREGRGLELRRIHHLVFFACPNTGSEFLLSLRGFWRNLIPHPQEAALRPFDSLVYNIHRHFTLSILNASSSNPFQCPIPASAYSGSEDGIVSQPSALSLFADAGTLPGDHSSIVRCKNADALILKKLRTHILAARQYRRQSPIIQPSDPQDELARGDVIELGRSVIAGASRSLYMFGGDISWARDYLDVLTEAIIERGVEVFAFYDRPIAAQNNATLLERAGVVVLPSAVSGLRATIADPEAPHNATVFLADVEKVRTSTVRVANVYRARVYLANEHPALLRTVSRLALSIAETQPGAGSSG